MLIQKLLELEKYIDEMNRGPWREKGVQVISLRRTAYLNVLHDVTQLTQIDLELQTSVLNATEDKPTSSVPPSLIC
jgi:hypothetical protein